MLTKKIFPALLIALPCIFLSMISCNSDNKEAVKTGSSKLNFAKDTLHRKDAANPYVANDQSPMDMSYYPNDYPILKMKGSYDSFGLVARVIYSRPQKKGRQIFGAAPGILCQYGKEWRLGANEATEIEFFKDIEIQDRKISKGRYIIYCIPYADKWEVMLNSNLFTWGLHMDKTKDIMKATIPVEVQSPELEDFTMVFKPSSFGTDLVMAWGNVKAVLPIKGVL